MRQIKLKKGYIAGVLALLMILSGLRLTQTLAAGAIDTSSPAALTLKVAEGGEFSADLKQVVVHVDLYRVASITETGAYVSESGFEELKLEELKGDDSTQWAALWEEKAQQAMAAAAGRSADDRILLENGTSRPKQLPQGMYLVAARETQSPEYNYSFTPYLISLPDNRYASTGNDDWLYEVEAGLKPEREPRFGDLIIRKTVTNYNAALGEAVFIFQVEAVKHGQSVYSNVVTTNHSEAGSKTALITGIPAGAEVTITEVYSGASYELTSAAEQKVTIMPEGSEEAPVKVEFTNTYNNQLNPGYGLVNHFDYDEENGWSLEKQYSNGGAKE